MLSRTESWLHLELKRRRQLPVSILESVAGVDALEAVGALSAETAAEWRTVFASDGTEDPTIGSVAEAEQLLTRLLPTQPEHKTRFEGALRLLSAVGAADASEWDKRKRRQLGWPETEEDDLDDECSELDLRTVLRGPDDVRGGIRLVAVLVFADGLTCLIEKDPANAIEVEWPEWSIVDDLGTLYDVYLDTDDWVSFTTTIPDGAAWIELQLEDDPDVRLRVEL
jgi:hypothetical protein